MVHQQGFQFALLQVFGLCNCGESKSHIRPGESSERCPEINHQTGMSIELSEDESELVVQALEHYDAYLHATSRRDGHARELADRLKGQAAKHRALPKRPTNRKKVHRRA
jgi:hypothetical protein